MSLYTLKEKNILKSFFIMAIFFALVGGIGWIAGLYFGSPFIFAGAVIFALGMNLYAYWNAHKSVLKATGAREVVRSRETEQLYDIVENLAITANIPTPKLYIIEDPSPNAFATGRSPKYGTVAVTTGLLQALDKNELEGVIAHELSHIQNRDTLVMTVVFALAGIVAIVSDFLLHATFFGSNDRNPLLFVVVIIGALLAPLAATLLKMGVSRKREYVADANAALLTRYPEGLASALEKIQQHAAPLQKKQHSVAHFFISDPYKANAVSRRGKKPSLMQRLFSTHPPTEDRIARLRGSI